MLAAVYPAPLGLDVPAPRPLPPSLAPPPFPAGGQFKPERAGRRHSGLAGGGTRCRQKTAAVRGRGLLPWGRDFAVWPHLHRAPPTAPAHETRPGARRCRPRVPPAACSSRLPPSTAAMATALGPRLRRGLFAPSTAVASAWRGGAGCASRASLQLCARFAEPRRPCAL